MEFSPEALFLLLLRSFFFGIILGGVYDAFRVFRAFFGENLASGVSQKLFSYPFPLIGRLSKEETAPENPARGAERPEEPGIKKRRHAGLCKVLSFLGDVLFCGTAAIGIMILAYVGNEGRIRYFMPLGAGIGFFLYRKTAGRAVEIGFDLIVFAIRVIFAYLFLFVTFPFRFFGSLLFRLLKKIWGSVYGKVRLRYLQRRTSRETARFLLLADSGFGLSLNEPEEEQDPTPKPAHPAKKRARGTGN